MNGWQALLAKAAPLASQFDTAVSDPFRAQWKLLASILSANAETEFGRRHGFRAISTLEAYQASVLVCTYDDCAADFARIAQGEASVLTASPAVAFEETGGSASGAKLIAYTRESLAAFRAAVLPWLHDLAVRHPAVCDGRAYVAISPATRQPRSTGCGLPVGLQSDAAYLGEDLVLPFLNLLAVPPSVGLIADVGAWRLATLAHLLDAEDLSFVSVWSPTFFLGLIEAIAPNQAALSAKLSPAAQGRLASFVEGGGRDTQVLWPRLAVLSAWADGSSAAFAQRLMACCPQAYYEPKGLFSTEAAVTIPHGGRPGCVPALNSTFLEFASSSGDVLPVDALSDGEAYRVIITTPGGLYRYDTGDLVRCVGHDGPTPRLVFGGREALASDMVGEKLDDAFAAAALSGLPCPAALRPVYDGTPFYELWLDAAGIDECQAAATVEARLAGNPQYAYARKMGQLGPIVPLEKPGFRAADHQRRIAAGARLGDLKHAALILPYRE